MAIQQDLSGDNYGAVIPITASAMFTPKRDATNGVLTAGLKVVTLTDQTGAAVGTSGNPLYVDISGGSSPAPYKATPKGFQQLTLSGGAQSLTVPTGAMFAIISVEGPNVRWRDDGVAPTATVGMILYTGGAPQQFSGDLATLQFIQVTGTSTLDVSYYV